MEVRPCPFCGSDDLEPSFVQGAHELFVSVSCGSCQAEGPPVIVPGYDKARAALEKAHTLWNERTQSPTKEQEAGK